ncbi:MAG: response regulator [Microthrixaceae bacterium]|nr:response regulator [Microthrixaceae bacterium]
MTSTSDGPPQPPDRPVPDQPVHNRRILVVDDRQQNVLLTRRILGKGGYTKVRSATDSRAALAMVNSWEPALVILDLHMPHMGGTEFIQRLRGGTVTRRYWCWCSPQTTIPRCTTVPSGPVPHAC